MRGRAENQRLLMNSFLQPLLDALIDRLGEAGAITVVGGLIGVAFGFFAQRSRFCLRSAAIEFARNTREGKLTVWLFAFSTAVVFTQLFIVFGWLNVGDARQLTARGSLSGAAIGGAMFGVGMILARGCSSRLWCWPRRAICVRCSRAWCSRSRRSRP